jgi:hypothetical protein
VNERDLETRLRSTYRSRAERTDPGALTERVHSIPATVEPERRRWWHRFRTGATRHAGPGGAQVRGANNMLAVTGITAAFAVLALGTTFLAVQVGDPPETAPQPAAQATDGWAIVTGTQFLTGPGPDCAIAGLNLNISDPRLAGDVCIEGDACIEGDVCIDYEEVEEGLGLATFWSSITITNDDGSWQGHSVGFMDEQGAHHHMGWFEGRDAYEGLAFIQQLTEASPVVPSAGGRLDMVGLIYEGELPPMVIPDWAADTSGDAE